MRGVEEVQKQMAREINLKAVPEINIGMVGHVAHGKTTLTQALTGKLTLTHSEELKRGITIRLGYADATVYKCTKCEKYFTTDKCPYCLSGTEIVRTVSFIDAPGHETLMATVLTGTSLMDGAILVIDSTQKCPQPQTIEHLAALEVVGIKNVVVAQTKIDLVSEERALESYREIKNFLKGTIIESSPVIPVSAQQKVNIDFLLEAIEEKIPTPMRDETKEPRMLVARSFDINKPGATVSKLVGGILGGSILQGKLKLGDEIEIRPGVKIGDNYRPLKTKIVGLRKGGFGLEEAGAGGLLGVMTQLDPYLTKSDSLVGNVVGLVGKLPETRNTLLLEYSTLKRFVGSEDFQEVNRQVKVGENLLLNVGTSRSIGVVSSVKKNLVEIQLKIPIVSGRGERVVVSRQLAGRWRLAGYGTIQ